MATRRTTVIALGGLLAGGGAVLGTGAFDSVEAQRSVALETANDSDAFLAFEIIDDDHVGETGGTIDFDLVAEATTTYEELVDVRNQGTQTVTSLRFEFDVVGADQPDAAVEDAMKITSGEATIDAIDEANLLAVSDAGDAGNDELSPGEAVPFGIAVDLTSVGISSIDGDPEITLTIIAETGDQDDGDGGDGGDGDGTPAFAYSAGPTRDPPNTPPESLRFGIENVGDGAATVEGFRVDVETPGGSQSPDGFEGFEIDPPAAGELTDDDTDTSDALLVGADVLHTNTTYEIPVGSTAEYVVETFDRDPSQEGELRFTVITDDGRFTVGSGFTGFESPGN